MKGKIGVIGGLGTDTAAQFYIEVEKAWKTSGGLHHVSFMLDNIQSPFELEQSLIQGNRVDEILPHLICSAKNLEHAGATVIAIPCNTVHVHIQAIRDAVRVPILSITEEVASQVKQQGVKQAAIFGTRTTRDSGIYTKPLLSLGISAVFPAEKEQYAIETIISRSLCWKNDLSDEQQLLSLIASQKAHGADVVVLACTDLQLCMPKDFPDRVIDSMHVLAEATVTHLLKGEHVIRKKADVQSHI